MTTLPDVTVTDASCEMCKGGGLPSFYLPPDRVYQGLQFKTETGSKGMWVCNAHIHTVGNYLTDIVRLPGPPPSNE